MKTLTLLLILCLSIACGGGGSAPTTPSPAPTATSPAPGTPTTTTPPAAAPTQCRTVGDRLVTVGRTSADGIFTHAPFDAADLALITNGVETNDPRFAYQWIKNRGASINIYAPADGVLIRLRHKAENLPIFPSDDFDLIFLAACDPARPGERDAIFRFNHITDPRPDIRAVYGFGALPAPDLSVTPGIEHEERQVPTTNIAVKAGELLGSTRGTPTARNFDFAIAIANATVCPFTALSEPHRSALLGLLGPQTRSPSGPPVPGYPCQGYGGAP